MVLAHPERVQALIVQNAVAHNEGLGAIRAARRVFWADRPAHEAAFRENFLSFATTKSRHIGNDPQVEFYDPDLWADEYASLSAPGQAQTRTDLFYDYRTNVAAYPKWQALGRPVLTANQVAFWYALRQAGVHAPVNGYDRLFRTLNSEGE